MGMVFRTEQFVEKANFSIEASNTILCMGSCFSQVIGAKLAHYGLRTIQNPFGTIYNPESLAAWLGPKPPDWDKILVLYQNKAYNLMGSVAATKPDITLSTTDFWQARWQQFQDNNLKKANIILLTLGTAMVYRLKSNQISVANCHKLPADWFEKTLLSVDQIMDCLEPALSNLNDAQIILTVSPVRHTKDTLVLNNVSKGSLLLATHQLCQKYAHIHYFPAYELLIDDLRDYRFYGPDLIHPSDMAQDYIWDKFCESYLPPHLPNIFSQWDKIMSRQNHRFIDDSTQLKADFEAQTKLLIEQFMQKNHWFEHKEKE